MENKKRLIDANALMELARNHVGGTVDCNDIARFPTIDAVEVVHGYSVGDVCFYGYGSENKSLALVEIVKILNDERGVAELKFLKVFVDDTGNGLFNYLLKSGKTMNGCFKYLKNITPNCGAKMDGDVNG